MASFEYSFRSYYRKECGLSGRCKDQKALAPLKTCAKDISGHLNGCKNTTSEGVDAEWKLCLLRVAFVEEGDSFTICPSHRDKLGLGWRPTKACKYPMHDRKQKPTKGVTRHMSQAIYSKYNILCETGQG